jgi:hypothetical protein
MPTTLPIRCTSVADPHDGLLGFARALLRFYLIIAAALAVLSLIEERLGVFRVLTPTELLLTVTMSDTDFALIDHGWARAP